MLAFLALQFADRQTGRFLGLCNHMIQVHSFLYPVSPPPSMCVAPTPSFVLSRHYILQMQGAAKDIMVT